MKSSVQMCVRSGMGNRGNLHGLMIRVIHDGRMKDLGIAWNQDDTDIAHFVGMLRDTASNIERHFVKDTAD